MLQYMQRLPSVKEKYMNAIINNLNKRMKYFLFWCTCFLIGCFFFIVLVTLMLVIFMLHVPLQFYLLFLAKELTFQLIISRCSHRCRSGVRWRKVFISGNPDWNTIFCLSIFPSNFCSTDAVPTPSMVFHYVDYCTLQKYGSRHMKFQKICHHNLNC